VIVTLLVDSAEIVEVELVSVAFVVIVVTVAIVVAVEFQYYYNQIQKLQFQTDLAFDLEREFG